MTLNQAWYGLCLADLGDHDFSTCYSQPPNPDLRIFEESVSHPVALSMTCHGPASFASDKPPVLAMHRT